MTFWEGATMDNLDLGCEQAAEQVLNRARDEELAIAYAKSTLASQQALDAALSLLADRVAEKPPSRPRRRTIRIARDEDGAMVAEDIDAPAPADADGEGHRTRGSDDRRQRGSAPVNADVEPVPATPAGPFANVLGTIGDA
jgi:hypothetical protein